MKEIKIIEEILPEKLVVKEKEKIVFNPDKNYIWKYDDRFEITGKEFEMLNNTIGSIFTSNVPQAQMYIMLHEIWKVCTNVVKRNVENGKMLPAPEEATAN